MTSLNLKYGDDLYHKYTKYCKLISENYTHFENFKKHPSYTYMLEHVTYEYGKKYINLLKTEYRDILQQLNWVEIHKHDRIGSPNLYDYSNELKPVVILSTYMFSPTTFRYLYIALDILSKNKGNNIKSVVEIGGGYGGQALLLLLIAPLFEINIRYYTIIDVYYPTLVQKKYLRKFNVTYNVVCTTINKYNIGDVDLLISNYALSEIQREYQNSYIPLVQLALHGYMLWNRKFIMPCVISKKPMIVDEVTKTTFRNKLIYF